MITLNELKLKQPLKRVEYLKSQLINTGVGLLSLVPLFMSLVTWDKVPTVSVGFFLVSAACLVVVLIKGLALTHRRLLDVFVGYDIALVWFGLIVLNLFLSGFASLALYFLPSRLLIKK